MRKLIPLFLIAALLLGQLIKIPQGTQGGVTLLDVFIIIFDLLGLIILKFKMKKPAFWLLSWFPFILIASISLILTPLKLNFFEFLNSFAYTIRFLAFLIFAWLTYQNTFSYIKEKTLEILLFSGIGLAIIGIIQFIFLPDLGFLAIDGWDPHYFRTVSSFLDPNFAGAYFVLTLILITQFKFKWRPLFFALVYIAFITTFSRSAALMFLSSFLIVSFFQKSIKLSILTLLLILGFTLSFFTYQQIIAQPNNIDRQQSAGYRLESWEQGVKLFSTHPFIGVGFNSYKFALREYNLTLNETLQNRGSTGNDSSLLFIASTTGIIGLISYLAALSSLLVLSLKNYLQGNKWGLVLFSGLAGLLIQSFFINNLFYPFFLAWIVLTSSQLKLKH